jgi:hypothetical protein
MNLSYINHVNESRRLAAASLCYLLFAIACVPWCVVAFYYDQPFLGAGLIIAATVLGHGAFLRAQQASFEMDLALEAEAAEARATRPKL